PARRHVPELGEVRVLEGFDADDRPLTRPPRSEITVGQLMLHTAGFGYEFFSADDQRYRRVTDTPSIISNCFDALRTVLLFDPGERWNYGCNIDWVGRLIENVHGRRLGEVMAERLFAPLGIEDTA
ncbi:serine hydrolase domain-containing protein, partial [Salmonella enterica]|uniref:serine hydrolase domain-containing protein n=1 Tax=Salmonella enterica TaxID=28901 RepID=UPI003FA742D7